MHVKCCFFILFGCLVALPKPQNHVKMHVFCSWEEKNTVKMQVLCFSWGPGVHKKTQLGLLSAGCEALFLILCKTRKHCKNAGIGPFLCLLGLWSPPMNMRGFATKPFFSEIQKNLINFQSEWLFFGIGLPKKLRSTFVKIGFASFCTFDEKQHKLRKNAGILRFGPKPARAQIHPNCKIH